MHMGNELLTLPVAGAFVAAAAAGVAYASAKARKELDEKRVPLLGVLGAFVFAAQMVNFPVLPGATGHFVGGALLAIVLGPHAAALGMAAIVIVQCVVFQDGGLLALGTNVFNMAVLGPYVAHAVFRGVVPEGGRGRLQPSRDPSSPRLYGATFLAALASILAGAVLVPVQVVLSGVSRVPFRVFLGAMVGIHALIGAVEGVITFAVMLALARIRPELVPGRRAAEEGLPVKTAFLSVLGAAVVVGGLLSLTAAGNPDGLDFTLERHKVAYNAPEIELVKSPAAETADRIARKISALPDYNRPAERWYWTSVAGVSGILIVLGLAYGVGRLLGSRKSRPVGGSPPSQPGLLRTSASSVEPRSRPGGPG